MDEKYTEAPQVSLADAVRRAEEAVRRARSDVVDVVEHYTGPRPHEAPTDPAEPLSMVAQIFACAREIEAMAADIHAEMRELRGAALMGDYGAALSAASRTGVGSISNQVAIGLGADAGQMIERTAKDRRHGL